MRVWTKCVYEWVGGGLRLNEVESQSFEYHGPVAICKGDNTAKQTELLAQQNMANQMQFNQQLMGMFQIQFGKQSAIMDYLKGKMQPIIDAGGVGFAKDALAAMRTSATDRISGGYMNAQRALQARQFTSGSRDLPSGVNEQMNAALLAEEAANKSSTQNAITLQNEQVKQTNYWNAVNELNGVGATMNPLGYAGAATGAANSASEAGNSVANLSQAYTASQQSGLMGMLGGLAGGVFGAAGQAKGFGTLFCWIASAVFAEPFDGIKTTYVRMYLLNKVMPRWYGKPILALYSLIGRWVARQPILVKLFTPLFRWLLKKAQALEAK